MAADSAAVDIVEAHRRLTFDRYTLDHALKDPRSSPLPFYIGKGTGSRAYDHLVIPEISAEGPIIYVAK